MTKFKAVLFDWEGVIGAGDSRPFGWVMERLPHEYGVSIEAATEALLYNVGDFMVSKIDNDEFWRRVGAQLGVQFNDEWRQTIWQQWHGARPLPEMAAFVKEVRMSGVRTVVLSNILPASAAEIRRVGGYELFDAEVLSCKVGARKPEQRIYNLAVAAARCLPIECIFIDDQQRYLDPAVAMGITTVLATSTEQTIRDVRRLLA